MRERDARDVRRGATHNTGASARAKRNDECGSPRRATLECAVHPAGDEHQNAAEIQCRRDAVLASIPTAPLRTGTGQADGTAHASPTARSAYTAGGQLRASRAAQFMPFAALTGYYELARKQERVTEPQHELTEEEAEALSRTAARIRRGDRVRVTYYDEDAYRTMTGIVARIDLTQRVIQVVRTPIAFDRIRTLERAPA